MIWIWLQAILLTFSSPTAQGPVYTVIAVQGKVNIKNEGRIRALKTGESIKEGQLISIGNNGFASLIDAEDRKVDLSIAGDYSYEKIHALFGKTEQSLYNRLLAKVSYMMSKPKEEKVSHPGAVFRGAGDGYAPGDSTVVLDNTITFRFENEATEKLKLVIRNARTNETIAELTTMGDSLTVPAELNTGYYAWQVLRDGSVKTSSFFVIPDADQINRFKTEYRELIASISAWPAELQEQVILEWKQSLRLLWTE